MVVAGLLEHDQGSFQVLVCLGARSSRTFAMIRFRPVQRLTYKRHRHLLAGAQWHGGWAEPGILGPRHYQAAARSILDAARQT